MVNRHRSFKLSPYFSLCNTFQELVFLVYCYFFPAYNEGDLCEIPVKPVKGNTKFVCQQFEEE